MSSEGELFIDSLLDDDKVSKKLGKDFNRHTKIWEKKYHILIDSWAIDKPKGYYNIWHMGEIEADTLSMIGETSDEEYKIADVSFDVKYGYEKNEYGDLIVSEVYPVKIKIKFLEKPERWVEDEQTD